MQFRRRSPSEIRYTYIAKEAEYVSPSLPPQEVDNNLIAFLKFCPKDLLQLIDPIYYFEFSYRFLFNNSYDFSIVYDVNFRQYSNRIFLLNQVKLFFVDGSSRLIDQNLEILKKRHSPLHFYYIFNLTVEIELENRIKSPQEFMFKIIETQKEILEVMDKKEFSICPALRLNYKSLIKFEYFVPTRNNYLMINNLIGNFFDAEDLSEEELNEKLKQESGKAHKKPLSFDRQNLIVDQISKLDYFVHMGVTQKIFKQVTNAEPILAPLIICAPFHNPDFRSTHSLPETKEIKDVINAMQTEQTSNYISYQEVRNSDLKIPTPDYMISLVKYLDNLSFLHAANFFSPIIRLPIKGKSIYRELSFFRTSAFGHLDRPKNRKNLKATISKFATLYKKTALSPKLEKVIKTRGGQIILISDLPLEWLEIENVPMAYTHDICRLPQTSLAGLLSAFAINNEFEYIIPENILEKTLVIFASDEPQFKIMQERCIELSLEKGFNTARCNSIDSLEKAINKYRPEFLIFDCHGSYDESLRSTVLWIGSEKLTPEVITEKNISAPIIFLSACGTAPTYGTINSIANSFFGTGCFSVTATYLPIGIFTSSVLYIRLLNNLSIAAKNGLFKNWLEFVADIIRTSFLMEKFGIAATKANASQREKLTKLNIDILTLLRWQGKRRESFLSIDKKIREVIDLPNALLEDIVPEYLFYSNLGRSDLIYFKSWVDKFKKENDSDIDLAKL